MAYKNIPVSPEVYELVRQRAIASHKGQRGLGAQIAEWAAECPHPAGQRRFLGLTEVTYPHSPDTIPGARLFAKVQIYLCAACNHLLVLPTDPFDADMRMIAARQARNENGDPMIIAAESILEISGNFPEPDSQTPDPGENACFCFERIGDNLNCPLHGSKQDMVTVPA
jgi:hypothetical protein